MEFVQLAITDLSHGAVEALLAEFITREGTDYGIEERTFQDKMESLRLQLKCGDVVIVFDPELQSANIVPKEHVQRAITHRSV